MAANITAPERVTVYVVSPDLQVYKRRTLRIIWEHGFCSVMVRGTRIFCPRGRRSALISPGWSGYASPEAARRAIEIIQKKRDHRRFMAAYEAQQHCTSPTRRHPAER